MWLDLNQEPPISQATPITTTPRDCQLLHCHAESYTLQTNFITVEFSQRLFALLGLSLFSPSQ